MVSVIRDILTAHHITAAIDNVAGILIIHTPSLSDAAATDIRTALNDCNVTVHPKGTVVTTKFHQ